MQRTLILAGSLLLFYIGCGHGLANRSTITPKPGLAAARAADAKDGGVQDTVEVCHMETEIGSHVAQKVCETRETTDAERNAAQDWIRQQQDLTRNNTMIGH